MAVAKEGEQGAQTGGMKPGGGEETPHSPGGAKPEGAGNSSPRTGSTSSAKSLHGAVSLLSGLKKTPGGGNSQPRPPSQPSGGEDEAVFEDDLPLGTEAISYSGGASTGEHVDLLLQGRQVDPEQVLVSLGFAPQLDSPPPVSKIPARFLMAPSKAAGITLDEFFGEYPDLHMAPGAWRKRATLHRAAAGWRAARSMSTVLSGAKAFGNLHAEVTARRSATPPASHAPSASPGHPHPPGPPTTILHPDNHKYLAARGFYNNQGGGGGKAGEGGRTRGGSSKSEPGGRVGGSEAAERRQRFRKSKTPWSLVHAMAEEEEEEEREDFWGPGSRAGRQGWKSRSADEVEGGKRTGGGGGETGDTSWLSSMDTCSSDSVMTSEESPQASSGGIGGEGGGRLEFDFRLTSARSLEDLLSLPDRPGPQQHPQGGIGSLRQEEVRKAMSGIEDGMEYVISPPQSGKTSAHRPPDAAAALTRDQAHEEKFSGHSTSHAAPPALQSSTVQTLRWQDKNVRIVVSNDHGPLPHGSGDLDLPDGHVTEGGGHLSIASASAERLSDTESGSEYTVVDQQQQRSSFTSLDSGGDLNRSSKRDENDNLQVPPRAYKPGEKTAQNGLTSDDSELPRMGSMQSDSSGFGDVEMGADLPHLDGDHHLKVTRMGSSNESAATLRFRDSLHDCLLDSATQTSTDPSSPLRDGAFSSTGTGTGTGTARSAGHWGPELESSGGNRFSHSSSLVVTPAGLLARQPQVPRREVDAEPKRKENQSYMTVCFIPPLKQTSTLTRQNSGATVSGEDLVLGKTRVSMVIPEAPSDHPSKTSRTEKPRALSFSSYNDARPATTSRRPDIFRTREMSLAEELAFHQEGVGHLDSAAAPPGEPLPPQWESYAAKGDNCHVSVLNLSVTSSELGSRFSVLEAGEGGSDCSYCSTGGGSSSAATGSHVGSETLDYRKLLSLVNQPLTYKGKRRHLSSYRPKRHVRDWVGLVKKQRLQEETRLLQQALRRYDTELHVLETEFLLQFQTAASELSRDEREEVEEMRFLWTEIQQQVREMEQLLDARMRAVAAGNDFFTPLSSLGLVGRMIEVLKEQLYQQRVARGQEEEELEDFAAEWPPPVLQQRPLSASWWALGAATPAGPWGASPFSPPPPPPQPSPEQQIARSMQELRGTLMSEFRQELQHSTQQLHLDIKARDNEIKRLQLEILQEKINQGSRSAPQPRSRPPKSPRSNQSTPSTKLRETTV